MSPTYSISHPSTISRSYGAGRANGVFLPPITRMDTNVLMLYYLCKFVTLVADIFLANS